MEFFILLYIAILGLFIGSFLNVVGLRIPKGESIISPPSHCISCQHRLGMLDLIPVFSYLLLKGRCRYCGAAVSPLYVIGELGSALLFVLLYLHFGLTWELLIGLAYISVLIAITISDLLYKIIPNKVILPSMAIFALLRLWQHPLPLFDYLIGFLLGGVLFYLIALLSRGGMGGGDIKLMALIGIVSGWKLTLLTIMIASFTGTIIGGVLIALGKIKRKEPIPFGPFIALAAAVAYLWGEQLITWYLTLM